MFSCVSSLALEFSDYSLAFTVQYCLSLSRVSDFLRERDPVSSGGWGYLV